MCNASLWAICLRVPFCIHVTKYSTLKTKIETWAWVFQCRRFQQIIILLLTFFFVPVCMHGTVDLKRKPVQLQQMLERVHATCT